MPLQTKLPLNDTTEMEGMRRRISDVVNSCPSTKIGTLYFDGTSWSQCDYGDIRSDIKLISELFLKFTNISQELLGFCVSPSLSLPALVLSATISSCPFIFLNQDGLTPTLLDKLRLRFLVTETPINSENFKFCQTLDIRSNTFMVYNYTGVADNFKITENEKYLYATTTSGSTGVPKVIRVPGESILPNVLDFSCKIGSTCNSGILLSTSLTFDPAILEFYLAILNSAPLVIVSKKVKQSPQLLLQAIKEGRVGFYQTTPSLFKLWSLEQKRCLLDGSSLKVLVLGGERFPSMQEVKNWRPNQNVSIYNAYGLTEVSCWATLNLAFPNDDWKNFSELGLDIGETLSETLVKSTEDESCELLNLMIGSATRICAVENETFEELGRRKPVFRFTGDLFKIVNGKYYFCYRNDSVVKRFGKKINVPWIEEKCLEIGLDVAVSVRYSDSSTDLRLLMFIVGSEESKTIINGIRSLKAILPGDHWPDEIRCVKSLPLSSHGKLDRRALKKYKYMKSDHQFSTFTELWNRFTNGTSTGENRNKGFVASGGNSYTAVQFINSLKEASFSDPPDLLLSLLKDESFTTCWEMLRAYVLLTKCRSNKRKLSENGKNEESTLSPNVDDRITSTMNDVGKKRPASPASGASTTINAELRLDGNPNCSELSISGGKDLILHQQGSSVPSISMALKGRVWPANPIIDPVWTAKSLNVKKIWSVDLKKCVDASPLAVLTSNRELSFVIVGSHSGLVAVLRCSSGEIISCTQLPARVEASACLSSDHEFYFIGCYDGKIYKIRIDNGSIGWGFQTLDQVKSTCVLHLGKLFVGSYDKYTYALEEGGNLVWKQFVGPVTIPVLPHGPSVIVGTLTNVVWRLKADDGSVLTKTEISSPIFSDLVLTFLDRQCCILVSPVEGPILWKNADVLSQVNSYEIEGNKFASPVVSSDEQLIISSGKIICCLQSRDVLWTKELTHRIVSTPFVVGLYVIVVTIDGTLHILDKNGVTSYVYTIPGEVFSSPVVVGSRVFFGCRDNNVYCLDISQVIY